MSWSVYALGKAPAVSNKLAADFTKSKCLEPEESIKQKVAEIVTSALSAFPETYAVKVEASGSQSTIDGKSTNQLKVSIDPIWGFVE